MAKRLRIEYELYEQGIMVCDYSNCHHPRFCGKDMVWKSKPEINKPFESKVHARQAVNLYFTGKQT